MLMGHIVAQARGRLERIWADFVDSGCIRLPPAGCWSEELVWMPNSLVWEYVCVCICVPVWIAGRLLAHSSVLCRRALLGWICSRRRSTVCKQTNKHDTNICNDAQILWSAIGPHKAISKPPFGHLNTFSLPHLPSSGTTVRVTQLPASLMSWTISLCDSSMMERPLTAEIRSPTFIWPMRSVGLPSIIRPILWGITETGKHR